MLFNTLEFFAFLSIVLLAFYLGPKPVRKPILLVASYYFYMSWNPKFIALLGGLTIIDYVAARVIVRSGAWRKTALVVSIAANLGFLGFFKYYNFIAENLAALLHRPEHTWALSIVLPLGISFHTFQSISYIVDVYRGEQAPVTNFIDYALFIAFFPQLVAGPIVRARDFFHDLYSWTPPSIEDQQRGALFIALGLAKKVILADSLSKISDPYFTAVMMHPGSRAAWTGVIAFAFQIFFDFSGYTDIAIGTALLLGFHFPQNFRRPYLAFSITDFWRRWHISLSSWLRDYLYIPLGGNRHGELQTYRNLLLTMLLGGLWHGASWNFVVWGAYHGSLLATERATGAGKSKPGFLRRVLGVPVTFLLACMGWIFFRSPTLHDSLFVVSQLVAPLGAGLGAVEKWLKVLLVISALAALAEECWGWIDRLPKAPPWIYASSLVALLMALELFGVTNDRIPFIYFQF